jgi:hypothetical protein
MWPNPRSTGPLAGSAYPPGFQVERGYGFIDARPAVKAVNNDGKAISQWERFT